MEGTHNSLTLSQMMIARSIDLLYLNKIEVFKDFNLVFKDQFAKKLKIADKIN